MTPWEMRAIELSNCNCDYGCPCQFNALPTHGDCKATVCLEITDGHYGDVRLDGVRAGAVVEWPGPIHEGGGRLQPFVDERATGVQRASVLKIMSGQDTDPMATVFAVFATTMAVVYEPIIAPVEFDVDIDARRGSFRVPGLVETTGTPIINPVSGQETRARIDLPAGFEFEIAEVASGNSSTEGKIVMDLENSHAHFAAIHLNNHGVVRHRVA